MNTSTGSHVHGSTITLLNEKISTHEVVRIFRNYLCFFCVPGTNNRPKEKQSRKTTKRRKQIGTKNMKLLYLHISPFTVCSQENILWKAGHRLCVPKQTIRRHSADRIPTIRYSKQSNTLRGEAVLCNGRANLTHAHRPHHTRRWSVIFPFAPFVFLTFPRLISIPGDGLTRTRLSKFPFSFTLSSSRGCRPLLHTHHSIWTLHSHAICCPILRSEPSISTTYFHSSIRTLQFPPSIQASVPIQTLDTCTHPSIWTLQLPPIYYARPSIWTLQFPSSVKRPRFNLDPPVQAISFAHASIRALQYPIRILAVFFFGGAKFRSARPN